MSSCITKVSSPVNYGLWVITLCHCSLINCNKGATVLGDVNNGGSARVKAEDIWEISVSFAQFCCKPKSALKIVLKIKCHFCMVLTTNYHMPVNLFEP